MPLVEAHFGGFFCAAGLITSPTKPMNLESVVPLILSMSAGRHFTLTVCVDGRPLRSDEFQVVRPDHGRCEIRLYVPNTGYRRAIGVTGVTEDKIILATADGGSVVLDVVPKFLSIALQDVTAKIEASHRPEIATELWTKPTIDTALGLLRAFAAGCNPHIVARINNRQVSLRHFTAETVGGATQIQFDTPPRMRLSEGCRAVGILKVCADRICLITDTGESAVLNFVPAQPAIRWADVARALPKSKRDRFLAGMPTAA